MEIQLARSLRLALIAQLVILYYQIPNILLMRGTFCGLDYKIRYCHNLNSTPTSTKSQLNSSELGLTGKLVYTPSPHPNSTYIQRSLRSTFNLTETTMLTSRTTTITTTTAATTTTTKVTTTTNTATTNTQPQNDWVVTSS